MSHKLRNARGKNKRDKTIEQAWEGREAPLLTSPLVLLAVPSQAQEHKHIHALGVRASNHKDHKACVSGPQPTALSPHPSCDNILSCHLSKDPQLIHLNHLPQLVLQRMIYIMCKQANRWWNACYIYIHLYTTFIYINMLIHTARFNRMVR